MYFCIPNMRCIWNLIILCKNCKMRKYQNHENTFNIMIEMIPCSKFVSESVIDFFHRWEYNYNVQRHQKKELISITFNITSLNDIYHEYMKKSHSYLKTFSFLIKLISSKTKFRKMKIFNTYIPLKQINYIYEIF